MINIKEYKAVKQIFVDLRKVEAEIGEEEYLRVMQEDLSEV